MKFGAQVTCYRNTWGQHSAASLRPWTKVPGPVSGLRTTTCHHQGRKEEEHLTAHEGFTVAAAVAGFTKHLEIGHLVLGNTYRNPGLVAKMATTVDQVSSRSLRPWNRSRVV